MKTDDLFNLCFSCLLDGCGTHAPITTEEAAHIIRCWREEGILTEDLSAEKFASTWNQVFYMLHFRV